MFSELINFFLIVTLVTIQSIVGIGVLVVGTPTLLLLNASIIEAMNFLLPISIITSFLNIILIKYKDNFIYYDLNRSKLFFIICIPFVFVGLVILKYTNKLINYDYLVSFLIIITLIYKDNISNLLKNLSIKSTKIILMFIGIIHGMTNSGGTLLSIFSMNLNNSKSKSRSEITVFYLFLALIQFILFYFIFGFNLEVYRYHLVMLYITIGILLGNMFLKFTSEILFRKVILFLALISSVSLIFKNILII
jgi:uncharacterized membrane protein YfcA